MATSSSGYDRALSSAIAQSHLDRLPAKAREALLDRSTRVDVPARSLFFRPGDPPRTALMVTGLARFGVVDEGGHDLTVLWAHPGEWIGVALVVETRGQTASTGLFAQAVTDISYVDIPAALVRELALADVAVAWVIAEFLADRFAQAVQELLAYAQGDLRFRIVRRLLELAMHQPAGTPLIASITQEELAKAVGAARPSVARVLADLKRDGSIRSVRGGLLIARPDQLTSRARIGAA
jgi:CRP/FNR family transcriptional regulator